MILLKNTKDILKNKYKKIHIDFYQTCFRNACSDGNLIKNPQININILDKNDDTVFHIICRNGHLKIIQFLMKEHQSAV